MASIISAGTTSGTALNMAGDTSGVLQLATNGSTTAVTVDASQNVGIGTTSPAYKLDVQGSVGSTIASKTAEFNAAGGSIYSSYNDGTKTWRIGAGIQTAGMLSIRNQTDAIGAVNIDSSGNLLVNYTSRFNAEKFGVQFDGNTHIGLGLSDVQASGDFARFFRSSTTQVGSISHTSTATSYNTSSDYRLKNTIAPMTGALAKVAQLKPVTYKWKVDGSDGQGFIAHELQAIVPNAVTGEKDAVETYTDEDGIEQTRPVYQGVDTSFLVATLTAAIQEQQTIINDLKARITALEGAA